MKIFFPVIAFFFTLLSSNLFKEYFKSSKTETILLVSMNFKEQKLVDDISKKIKSFYNLPVKHTSMRLPATAYYPARGRYRADSILNYLVRLDKNQHKFVAALTSVDISVTSNGVKDWGIFGLGSFTGNACITSSYRLRKNVSSAKLLERLQKVVLHEIGHNQGLRHCTTAVPCFMKDAEGSIKTVDAEPMDLCASCRRKINL